MLTASIGFPRVPKATESEVRGEQVFFNKGRCAECHPAPFYLDNRLHDLRLDRFLANEPGDGPIKTFTLRGIKDGERRRASDALA
jgi:cytochrome c peroxidase